MKRLIITLLLSQSVYVPITERLSATQDVTVFQRSFTQARAAGFTEYQAAQLAQGQMTLDEWQRIDAALDEVRSELGPVEFDRILASRGVRLEGGR